MGGSRPSRTFRAFASLSDDNPSSIEDEREASNSPTRQARTPIGRQNSLAHLRGSRPALPGSPILTELAEASSARTLGRSKRYCSESTRPTLPQEPRWGPRRRSPGAPSICPFSAGDRACRGLGGRSRVPRSRRTFRGTKRAHVTVGLPLSDDASSEQHARKLRIAFVPS